MPSEPKDEPILPASDAIARVREAQRGLPGVLSKDCICPYCEKHVQYLDGRFHEVATGRLHTCPNEVAQRLRRRYAAGMFEWLDAPPAKEKPVEGPEAHSTGGNGYTLSIPLGATMQQSTDVCPARGTTNGAHCDHIMPYVQSSVGVSMKCCHCGRINMIVPATPPIRAGHGPHFPRTSYGF